MKKRSLALSALAAVAVVIAAVPFATARNAVAPTKSSLFATSGTISIAPYAVGDGPDPAPAVTFSDQELTFTINQTFPDGVTSPIVHTTLDLPYGITLDSGATVAIDDDSPAVNLDGTEIVPAMTPCSGEDSAVVTTRGSDIAISGFSCPPFGGVVTIKVTVSDIAGSSFLAAGIYDASVQYRTNETRKVKQYTWVADAEGVVDVSAE